MKSLFFKSFLMTAGMVLLCLCLAGIAFIILGRTLVISERREGMSSSASVVANTACAFEQDGDFRAWELRMVLSSVSLTTGNHIFITDSKGEVVNCSDMAIVCLHIGRRLPDSVIIQLESSGSYDHIDDLGGFYESEYYTIAVPIASDSGEHMGYVFVSSDSGPLMDAWRTLRLVFLMVALVVMMLALFFSYVTSKQQTRPINEMAAAARRFAHGDFSVRVGEDCLRQDEVGELTVAFNAMADSLERSEQQRSEFIANISHELKTPMTTIAGFADGILDGTIAPEEQPKYLKVISSETKRLSRLVRNMLELSRIQSQGAKELKKREFDVSELMLRTLLGLESKINEKRLDVQLQLPEESISVLGDPDGITQVVYNLLDNAIKFSPEAGVLTLTLWKQDGKAYVSIKNLGETISPEELPKIFDRFHKTDRSRSQDRDGVGLGLYIVKAIVGNHDEDIFVRSENGETEFVFTLTLAQK